MNAPLRDGLLFCLFSVLFGGAAAFFTELLRALFTSLRLLSGRKAEKGISLYAAVGFFLYDVLLFTSLASFYMIFLFVANEGVLRVHSILLAFFGFFADLVATYGPQITADYARGLAVYYPLCAIYVFTAFPLFALYGGGRRGPGEMLRHILRPAMVSLGTCSSVATIPTNMAAAEETGISKDVSDMVLPLGATMHMDGSCFSCVLKIAFVYGVLGLEFSWGMLLPVVLVAVLSSVGMSGVPGGGYIGEYIICSIFFPNQMELAFPILVTIGNLVDPPATMINASGDYVVSFIVSRFADGKNWLTRAKKAS